MSHDPNEFNPNAPLWVRRQYHPEMFRECKAPAALAKPRALDPVKGPAKRYRAKPKVRKVKKARFTPQVFSLAMIQETALKLTPIKG